MRAQYRPGGKRRSQFVFSPWAFGYVLDMVKVGWRSAILGVAANVVVSLGAGCGDGAGGSSSTGGAGGSSCGGSGGGGTGSECASWKIDKDTDTAATATLDSGALVLRRPGPTTMSFPSTSVFNNDDLALSQVGLTGDFDVKVEWEALQTGGGIWSKIEAGVQWIDPSGGYNYQVAGTVGGNGGQAILFNNPQFTLNNTNGPVVASALDGASGSFHLTRTTTGGSSTTTINGQSVTAQATAPLPDGPYTLFIGIGLGAIMSDTDQHNEESIRITRVTVSCGGGTVKSDEFACAALPGGG